MEQEDVKVKKKPNKIRIAVLLIILIVLVIAVVYFLNIGGVRVRMQADSQAEIPTQNVSSDSHILITYFAVAENSEVDAMSSASVTVVDRVAKGRIRALADMIQEHSGGDLYSIQTSTKYPGNIGKVIDFAQEEQDNNARPELTTQIENLEKYDVIFVGFPTWWYDLPQVMYSFFDEYDFSGKMIIPFNSANGSQFSGTIGTIKELEPNATVIENGLSVHERDIADAKSDVDDWLNGLGY